MAKKWGDIQNEILGLMFSNNTGGTKVSVSDSSNKEYGINMADAFNMGLMLIYSHVKPLKKYIDINVETPADIKAYNLKELCGAGYMAVLDEEVYMVEGERIKRAESFDIFSSDIFMPEAEGVYRIYYKSYGTPVSEETSEAFLVEGDELVLKACAYYAAHRLYLEDDMSIAMQYLNMFEEMKNSISMMESSSAQSGSDGTAFKSVRGWI